MKKEQNQRNVPSTQNTKPSTSKSFAHCSHCPRTNHSPEKSRDGPNATNRPKWFKKDFPAHNQIEGQEQGNLTHPGPLSDLKNPLKYKSHGSK